MIRQDIIRKLQEDMLKRRDEIVSLRRSMRQSWQQVQEHENELEEMASKETMGDELELLEDRVVDELQNIDQALDRIDDGSYGRCVSCKRPIATKRLQALPWTTICKRCANSTEARPVPDEEAEDPYQEDMADDQVVQTIWDALDARETLEVMGLDVRCDNGTIYLTGHVPGDHEYQLIMETVEEDLGFEDVIDQINVDDRELQIDDEEEDEEAYEEAAMMGQVDSDNPYLNFEDR